ncbi:hypothetical protein P618_200764 [Holospora obtusa F1]|uniref:Uncharacterized protein n=1 Tax=Holospora obtusa F1 TaxID=1399147 RepID=W6TGM0_HOLOB|nr:hypothetical protein [Holospora obtusa]ETZ07055.1 hypothetical protein P618_200764 [Holospora obtusa F1]
MIICAETGWGRKGKKLATKRAVTIIAEYVNHKSIKPMVFSDSCDTRLFEAWVKEL